MAMVSKEPASNKSGFIRLAARVGAVLAILLAVVALVGAISYVQRPQIKYSLQEADCSKSAIAARNRALGADLKSCVLVVAATNLKNTNEYVDYDGVGGGPIGNGDPLIRIYTAGNRFCYVALGGEGASFAPHATNDLTLRCAGVPNEPANYDMASDANPKYIEISANYSNVRLEVEPVR